MTGIYFDSTLNRWTGSIITGATAGAKRRTRVVVGKTAAEVGRKLQALRAKYPDGNT